MTLGELERICGHCGATLVPAGEDWDVDPEVRVTATVSADCNIDVWRLDAGRKKWSCMGTIDMDDEESIRYWNDKMIGEFKSAQNRPSSLRVMGRALPDASGLTVALRGGSPYTAEYESWVEIIGREVVRDWLCGEGCRSEPLYWCEEVDDPDTPIETSLRAAEDGEGFLLVLVREGDVPVLRLVEPGRRAGS